MFSSQVTFIRYAMVLSFFLKANLVFYYTVVFAYTTISQVTSQIVPKSTRIFGQLLP